MKVMSLFFVRLYLEKGLYKMTKFIFVAGGVISGVGKGVIAASLGKIMQEHGLKTTMIKIDPYINYDAGTLRPTEHGEVWVTADGGEIDQDLGNYERFLNQNIPKCNNITTGQIYKNVIDKERRGEYLGKTVQFIPHILDEIKERILQAAHGYEVVIIELGGTVGDYENTPYLFAIKSLQLHRNNNDVAYVLVSYMPVPSHIQDMKTKPTQQAVRLLGEQGVLPDFIVCRSEYGMDQARKEKLGLFVNVAVENIISAPDFATIYHMPLHLEQEELGKKLLKHLHLTSKKVPDWRQWKELLFNVAHPTERITIAIVGKYLESGTYNLTDSYLSIAQSLEHVGGACGVGIDILWVSTDQVEKNGFAHYQEQCDGIIVPGGFGSVGIEGKLKAIRAAREHNIPYLGLCYGFQLAVIEYARNVRLLNNAHTTEVDQNTPHPVIDILEVQKQLIQDRAYGGTMRLGSYEAVVKKDTRVHGLYSQEVYGAIVDNDIMVSERHRHRYEVNPRYISSIEDDNFVFSGYSTREDGTVLMEFLELKNHRFFVATQAHPEFQSTFTAPHPLFKQFALDCVQYKNERVAMPQIVRAVTQQCAEAV